MMDSTRKTLLAALVSGVALAASGCAGGGNEAEDTTTERQATQATGEEATTGTGPKPLTAGEKRWFSQLVRYNARFKREAFRSGTVTHGAMRRDIGLARECGATLRRAGSPGRFRPAAKHARRGCARLDRAARLLKDAIGASDPGGRVTVGTPEEKIFDRSLNGAAEAMGNAQYDLQRAVEVARTIRKRT